MFTVEIESSSDPILDILATDPDEIFNRPYAGYIFLLFGSADEEIATWFSRSLISLDSLTGADIACAIFAQKVKIMSQYHRTPGRYLDRWYEPVKHIDEGVALQSINKGNFAEPLVNRLGEAKWTNTPREITAITYGMDNVARKLDILGELPCIVFLDANPKKEDITKSKERFILPFKKYPKANILDILRKVIQNLRQSPGFEKYEADVKFASHLSELISDKNYGKSRIEKSLSDLKKDYSSSLHKSIDAITDTQEAILCGSKKLLKKSVEDIPEINEATIQYLFEAVGNNSSILVSFSRTLTALEYYVLRNIWDQETQSILKTIFEKYVAPLAESDDPIPQLITKEDCINFINILKESQSKITKPLFESFKSQNEIRTESEARFLKKATSIENKLENIISEIADHEADYAKILSRCISSDHPSLIECAKSVINPDEEKEKTEAENPLWDFFIAHAGSDHDFAEHIYSSLSTRKRVFLDFERLKFGDTWDSELKSAQMKSKVSLILITSSTEEAYYQREEIAIAIKLARNDKSKHRVIPIYIGEDAQKNTPYGLHLKHSIFLKKITDFEKFLPTLMELD